MSDWIGRTLSKVQIEKRIGRGGMAEVYLGHHATLNRPVAVKILHAHFSEDDLILSRFRAEAQAVAALRHPHIVHLEAGGPARVAFSDLLTTASCMWPDWLISGDLLGSEAMPAIRVCTSPSLASR